jgi:putative tricarboxylic transport membrane protein
MNRKDLLSSLIWMSIGLSIIIGSVSSLEIGTASEPGPALFPLLAGVLISFLSLVILLKAAFAKTSEKWSPRELWEGLNWPKIFYTIGALLIYAIMLERVGFLLMTLLLFIFLFIKIEPQKWKLAIGLSILASVGSYLIFDRLLQAQLPRGLLGF